MANPREKPVLQAVPPGAAFRVSVPIAGGTGLESRLLSPAAVGNGGGGGTAFQTGKGLVLDAATTPPTLSVDASVWTDDNDPGTGAPASGGTSSGTTLTFADFEALAVQAPTTEPTQTGRLWLNAGVLCVTGA